MEDSYFWKNIILGVLFFTLTPVALGLSIFTLVNLYGNNPTETPSTLVLSAKTTQPQIPAGVSVFASIPDTTNTISVEATAGDARTELIRQYLARYGSPLEPYATHIVELADKYGIDFRLITAIAQQESNLCKKIPLDSHNCWGWGIHSQGSLGFNSFEAGIETVTKGLRQNYIDLGFVTPDEIMTKYTPSSPGSWARGVNMFLEEME